MNPTLLSLLTLAESYQTQGRLGARKRKFSSSKVIGRPGTLCPDTAEKLLPRKVAKAKPVPAVKPIAPANTKAQMA